mgnify:CR=1 FL=1|tara:strand:+ start:117 stop:689 length:573 start_codon:yes stop_codon:yes gene_type:complete
MPGSIKIDDGSGNYTILTSPTSLGSDKTFTLKGPVLQAVSATDTTAATYTIAATNVKAGSLEVAITPTSTSSKILLLATIAIGGNGRYGYLNFYRDSTQLGVSDVSSGSRSAIFQPINTGDFTDIVYQALNNHISFVDSPSSTSAITYSIYIGNHHTASESWYYNRPENDTDAAYISRCRSTITAIEIGG